MIKVSDFWLGVGVGAMAIYVSAMLTIRLISLYKTVKKEEEPNNEQKRTPKHIN